MRVEPLAEHFLFVDVPSLAGGEAPVRVTDTLSVIGWGLAAEGVESIAIAVDGSHVINARYGLRRPDVAAAHPALPGALLSGYMAQLPLKGLVPGAHRITVTLQDSRLTSTSVEFRVLVEPRVAPPRAKMSWAELRLKETRLPSKRVSFLLVMTVARGDLVGARVTLGSLDRQVYKKWRLDVISATRRPRELLRALTADHPHLAERVCVSSPQKARKPASREQRVELTAGDELACDALLDRALGDGESGEVKVPEPEGAQCLYPSRPLFDPRALHRVLVVKLDHIGDAVAASAAVARLKQYYPQAQITLLSSRACLPLWEQHPAVDELVEFNFFHERSSAGRLSVSEDRWKQLERRLRAGRFDLAIDLRKQPDTRQVLRLSGAPWLAGFDFQGRFPWLDIALEWDEDVPLRDKRAHVADDLTALVERIHLQGSDDWQGRLPAAKVPLPLARAEKQLLSGGPYVCIHPAAGSPLRQWPADRFGHLIDLLVTRHKLTAVLVGSAADQPIVARVKQNTTARSSVLDLTGRLSLQALQRLMAGACLFIGNNSGPHHIAAALGVFTIGVHSGVVDAREWAPTGPRSVVVRRDMSCSPCYLERAEDCPRSLACLTGLSAAEVYRLCYGWITSLASGL